MTDTAPAADPDTIPTVVPVLAAANFVIGMGAFVIVGILPPLAQDTGLSTQQAGWLMSVYALAYAVLSPVLVSLTGHLGRRRLLTFALLVFAAAALISAAAPGAATLYAARVLAAAGAGLVTPVAAAVVAALAPPDRQARALAAVFFGVSLSQVLGVPAGSYLAYTFGWRSAFLAVTVLALPVALAVWLLVPAGLRFPPVTLGDLGRTLTNRAQMAAVSFTACFLGTLYIVYTFIAPLLAETMGLGRDGITSVLAIAGLGAIAGAFLGGQLSDRIGPVRTLALLIVAQILIMPAFSALPLPFPLLLLLVVAWNTFGWAFMAGQQVRLITLAPLNASVLLALNAGAIYVGAAAGSAVGGAVVAAHGLGALGIAGAIAMGFAAAALALGEWLRPRTEP